MSTDCLFAEEDLMPFVREWQNMPEYSHEDLAPQFSVLVHFACAADVEEFSALVGQGISMRGGRQLKSIWFPEQAVGHFANKRYMQERN